MSEIVLRKIWHRGDYRIAAFFDKRDNETRLKMKQIGARFSKTHLCWHLPYNKKNYNIFKTNFSNIKIEKTNSASHQKQSKNKNNDKASVERQRKKLPIVKNHERLSSSAFTVDELTHKSHSFEIDHRLNLRVLDSVGKY